MDSLPPNDPNRNNNNNNNNNNGRRAKEQPWDGRSAGRGGASSNQVPQDGQPMDVMGNMNDSPAAVVMFLVGVAAWLLRERCVC